ncbi:MAG: hypothetical protein N2C14_25560 [Planctomycetales bacterium]
MNRATWKGFHLRLVYPHAHMVDAKLLRGPDWLAKHNARVGENVFLDMPDTGAEVVAIEDCPEIEPGPGRVITGTFKHSHGELVDIRLVGESEVISATPDHPFRSVDQDRWVSASKLRVGETVKTLHGVAQIASASDGDPAAWKRNTGNGWNQNKLTPISPDPVTGQQAFHDTVVKIIKVG